MPGAHSCKLAIAIVNYRSAELTIDCLHSLEPEISDDTCVYVVENGSGDGSAALLSSTINAAGWDWVTLLCTEQNRGFAAGNNIAIRAARNAHEQLEYVLLLNPDTLVKPRAISILREFMAGRTNIGVAGGRSEDPDGTPQDCCFRFYTALSEFSTNLRLGVFGKLVDQEHIPIPTEPIEIDWVSGAFAMIRIEVIEQIGLLDESYFLYFEETDFIFRAKQQGWQCWHVPDARIVHLVGQSSGVTAQGNRRARRPAYWYQSRTRYFMLNYGRFYASLTDLSVALAYLMWESRRIVLRKREDPNPALYLRDLMRHSALWRRVSSLARRMTS